MVVIPQMRVLSMNWMTPHKKPHSIDARKLLPGLVIEGGPGRLIFRDTLPEPPLAFEIELKEGFTVLPAGRILMRLITPDRMPPYLASDSAYFDERLLAMPLRIRSRRPGDRMRLPNGGERKIKRIMIDAKWPRSRRQKHAVSVRSEQYFCGLRACAVGNTLS